MEGWVEFALGRYNYWIVIILMMTGLYTVFARGNLVKKVVGLNLFQTSVFIFYITIGKISGGTAPIYWKKDVYVGSGHSDDHSDDHGADPGHGANNADHGDPASSLHDEIDNSKIDNDIGANDLKAALEDLEPGADDAAPSLHEAPQGADKIANDALAADKPVANSFDIDKAALDAVKDAGAHGADAAHAVETGLTYVYTNPLPHVLILTAIVVGVATTAVGLALAVRIREAYGTIEEDELEAMDNVAEFGGDAESVGA